MKKTVSLVLILAICLSFCACAKNDVCTCECAQCAQCEKKTHSHETVNIITDSFGATAEQDKEGSNITFPEPVLLAEDNKVRIELVSFIQEASPWKDIGKYVTLKMTNHADYEVGVRLENLAVNNESADVSYSAGATPNILPGETTTYFIEIRDAFNNALDSLDQLYTLKGRFKVSRRTGTNSYTDAYEIPFSVPNSLNRGNGNAFSSSTGNSLKCSIYLGKWQVTEITFADDSTSSYTDEDAKLWETFFAGMLGVFEKVYMVFSESGNCYYHTEDGTTTGQWKETETGLQAGGLVFFADGNKLVSERDGYLLYWEKVSNDQTVPET